MLPVCRYHPLSCGQCRYHPWESFFSQDSFADSSSRTRSTPISSCSVLPKAGWEEGCSSCASAVWFVRSPELLQSLLFGCRDSRNYLLSIRRVARSRLALAWDVSTITVDAGLGVVLAWSFFTVMPLAPKILVSMVATGLGTILAWNVLTIMEAAGR
jgi:hypothetical protein